MMMMIMMMSQLSRALSSSRSFSRISPIWPLAGPLTGHTHPPPPCWDPVPSSTILGGINFMLKERDSRLAQRQKKESKTQGKKKLIVIGPVTPSSLICIPSLNNRVYMSRLSEIIKVTFCIQKVLHAFFLNLELPFFLPVGIAFGTKHACRHGQTINPAAYNV
ncbi:hypothetical protein AA313_de0204062 [Arthrobotrys entomopaga]|nr:hypothetical protein AA313_de0204062 [Arthrobotrys entomopaga]